MSDQRLKSATPPGQKDEFPWEVTSLSLLITVKSSPPQNGLSGSPWKKGADPLEGNGFTLNIACPERV